MIDPHVPKTRVDESAEVYARMGAVVNKQIYPGMGHLVTEHEIVEARALLDAVPEP